jgi:hypothetical protein
VKRETSDRSSSMTLKKQDEEFSALIMSARVCVGGENEGN